MLMKNVNRPARGRMVRVVTAFALSATLALSACGSDDNSKGSSKPKDIACASGSIQGAGSSFVQPIAQQWVKDYQEACAGTTVNYKGVGSGTGITQFNQGAVDFAASDVPMSSAERAAAESKYGSVIEVPWAAGAVALQYKLSGVEDVRLSPSTIARIYSGAIRMWNDPVIAADNPGRVMPSTPIQVMHRSDGSGTTAVFTQFLTAVAPGDWTVGAGKEVDWPTGQGLKGSDGVTAAVKQTEGAIGYAELSFAKANGLKTVKVKNSSGNFVGPDEHDGVTTALAEAGITDDGKVNVNFKATGAKAYPLASFTYVILPRSSNPNDEQAKLLSSFVRYAVGDGQGSAEPLSYAPLPDAVADKVESMLSTPNKP